MKKLLPADLPGIDVDSALNRLGDDEELLADVIISFKEDNLTTIAEIRHALETEEHHLAARLVHTLKGVSGNIGAETLYCTSRELEMAIKAQDQSEVRRLLESIEIELDTVFRAAELLETQSRDEPSGIAESPPDYTDLAPIFCELRDMLKTHNLKALQVYEQLENKLPGSSTEVVALNQCISKLDFRGAFEQLYLLADKYCIKM